MRKLRLKLDALKVESFDADPRSRAERGTVRGADQDGGTGTGGNNGNSGNLYCLSVEECVNTSWHSCPADSCQGTCAPPGAVCA